VGLGAENTAKATTAPAFAAAYVALAAELFLTFRV
jgi:hypothetical protein